MVFFLLNGATHNSSGYSSLWLVDYKFNNESSIYSMVASQYAKINDGAQLSDFSLKVGYLGMCVNFGSSSDEENDCGYTNDISNLYSTEMPDFTLTSSSSNSTTKAELQLLDLAKDFQKKVMKREIYSVQLIFLLALLVVQTYYCIGPLPFQNYALLLAIFMLCASFVILSIITVWVVVADYTVSVLGEVTSLNILQVLQNGKVTNILWAAFSLHVLEMALYAWIIYQLKTLEANNSKEDLEKANNGYGYDYKYTYSGSDGVMSSISMLKKTLT
ncbi:hypothetical protein DAMA08_015300 [Martiniozyma asiatica (nom. inval.)]|nr:hypothetical protein DAMA08_015300 [Martiniozyma asiatica]